MNCYMYLTTLGYTPPHPHAINGCDNSPVHARETTSSDLPDTPDTYAALSPQRSSNFFVWEQRWMTYPRLWGSVPVYISAVIPTAPGLIPSSYLNDHIPKELPYH